MTTEELSSIRPLKIAKAQEVYATLGDFGDNDIGLLKYSESTNIAKFSTEDEPATVQQWLEATIPHSNQPILLSWDPTIAVVTDLTTFIRWWDMFCYPGSDDVFIWPITEEWMLRYRHEEVFYFAPGSQENSGSSGFAGVIGKP